VRLLVRDDDVQAGRAAALFEQNEIFVCKTVLLETEWVLRFTATGWVERPFSLR
jgi:predicted nucleic-acid-binding protein